MIEQKLFNTVKVGIENAALLVQTASKFSSDIKILLKNNTINAKSIMGIMSLGSMVDNEITILVNGKDEKEAVSEIKNFFSNIS